jgi:hypothetical protein
MTTTNNNTNHTPIFIQKLYQKPYIFRRLITLSVEEFNLLVMKLEPEWREKEMERLENRKDRINKVGQGRPYALGSFSNLLLLTLMYLRTTLGYELLSFLFEIDKTTAKRDVRRVIPLLQDRFIPLTDLNKKKRRTNKLDDFLKLYPEAKDIIFDGTELPIDRPTRRQKQQQLYSGKKKRHTKKTQIALDKKTKLILAVSPPRPGKNHDKKQLEQTGWDTKLPQTVKRYGDLGYLGMSSLTWQIPHKKPKGKELSKQQKKENKLLAKARIVIEHAIRGIKIFRRIGETVRVKSNEFLFTLILAAANLYNFKRLVRQGIM